MKKLFLVFSIAANNFVFTQEYEDSLVDPQSYLDSINSSTIVKTTPNISYLKNLSKTIYFPTAEQINQDFLVAEIFANTLKIRYNCELFLLEVINVDENTDYIFEVSTKNKDSRSVVNMNLSVIEQLYQENQFDEALNYYCKWYDLYLNYYFN